MTDMMSDNSATPSRTNLRAIVEANVKQRYAAEKRFRAFGIAMVATAIIACGTLIASILGQSIPALTENRLYLNLEVTAAKVDPAGQADPLTIREQGDFYGLVQDGLVAMFATAEADGQIYDLFDVVTPLAAVPIGKKIAADPSVIGRTLSVNVQINDDLDMFLKGAFGKTIVTKGIGTLLSVRQQDGTYRLSGEGAIFAVAATKLKSDLSAQALGLESGLVLKRQRLEAGLAQTKDLEARLSQAARERANVASLENSLELAGNNVVGLQADINTDIANITAFRAAADSASEQLALSDDKPSVLVETQSGTYKLNSLTQNEANATLLVRPHAGEIADVWRIVQIATPQSGRAVNDDTIAFGRHLGAQGAIKPSLNTTIFTNSDSNEP
jgi:phosphate transport system permease protein